MTNYECKKTIIMKNTILILSMIAAVFTTSTEAQNRTTVNAMSNEISDNLDLRAVASIFGDSQNLEDFERRLNDPELQISNLDLNNDNEVDYLRVIETVEYNTHVVIIQSVLDRDVYQDVATIDIERNNNNVQVQFIGNEYIYGPNYIYEPVYYTTPQIYASFWLSNYRPYISMWYWNYYPSYYYAWNPYPLYRYQNNIHLCLNFNNRYNYVSYRRSNLAISLYNSRRSNAYERRYPNYAFSRRHSSYTNRHDIDRRRGTYSSSGRYNTGRQYNNTATGRTPQREYSSGRNTPSRNYSIPGNNTDRRYDSNKSATTKSYTPSRNYNQNNNNSSRESQSPRTPSRNYNQNNNNSRENQTARTPSRNYNQSQGSNPNPNTRSYAPRQENNAQRAQTPRENSSNRGMISRPSTPNATPQRAESGRSRSSNQRENNSSSRDNNRRI